MRKRNLIPTALALGIGLAALAAPAQAQSYAYPNYGPPPPYTPAPRYGYPGATYGGPLHTGDCYIDSLHGRVCSNR